MERIEAGAASSDDYQRYEDLLVSAGLPRDYVRSFIEEAGYDSWDAFRQARSGPEGDRGVSATLIGRVSGLGLGVLFQDSVRQTVRRELAG